MIAAKVKRMKFFKSVDYISCIENMEGAKSVFDLK
jgi:hypothetical protein